MRRLGVRSAAAHQEGGALSDAEQREQHLEERSGQEERSPWGLANDRPRGWEGIKTAASARHLLPASV